MVTFVVLRMVAVVLIVAANAFFVSAEFAMVSLRETQIQQMVAAHAWAPAPSKSCISSLITSSTRCNSE